MDKEVGDVLGFSLLCACDRGRSVDRPPERPLTAPRPVEEQLCHCEERADTVRHSKDVRWWCWGVFLTSIEYLISRGNKEVKVSQMTITTN